MFVVAYRKYRYFAQAAGLTLAILLAISTIYYIVQLRHEDYDTRKAKTRPAPTAILADVKGKTHNLKYSSGPGIVVIWTSWCGPCKEELRNFETADLDDLSYIAINADENSKVAIDFLKKERIRKPLVLFDPESRQVPATSYPTVYLNHGDGTWAGPLMHTEFKSLLQEIRHTLNRTAYKPYKASKAANEQFWQSVYWQYLRFSIQASPSLFFGVLLLIIWKVLETSRLLISSLLLHFVLATCEGLGFLRLTDFVQLRGTWGDVVSFFYYWPVIWGGLIALGIMRYLHRAVTERENVAKPIEPASEIISMHTLRRKTERRPVAKSRKRTQGTKTKMRT